MVRIILERILKIFLTLLGGLLGYALIHWIIDLTNYQIHLSVFKKEFIAINGGLTGLGLAYFTAGKFISKCVSWISKYMEAMNKVSSKELIMGSIGIIIGLIIANLINITLIKVPNYIGILLALMSNFLFSYLGVVLFTKKKDILENFDKINIIKEDEVRGGLELKVIDTSAIIDGRIVDICKAGFLEGIIVIPDFILKELRHIADSHDPDKRTRGRRGLDILNIMQKESKIKVEIYEEKIKAQKNEEVDVKLLKVAMELGAKVITTDYNLNRIADFQGIFVLNINELAKSIKPIALPGEEMIIKVIKDGKESGQGIGYLDDGTMVVVDDGKKHMGETIGVQVVHVLQTNTGRMIFAKPKYHIESVG